MLSFFKVILSKDSHHKPLLVCVFFFISLLTKPVYSDDTVFFFNSETNVDNFATLKGQFDSYLSQQGTYSFQPFSERTTFENTLSTTPKGLYLMSGSHFSQLNSKLGLQAMMVGSHKGDFMQRKVLTSSDIQDLQALKGTTIAGAGSEESIRAVLRQMLSGDKDGLLDSIKVLVVPKDIDALMAVSFGIAKSSISSENGLTKFSMINPTQRAKLKTLAESEKSFVLIAAISRKKEGDEKNILQIFEDMSKNPEGEKDLKLLGLDGWKKVSELDATLSKQLR